MATILICTPGSLLYHLRPKNQIVHEPPKQHKQPDYIVRKKLRSSIKGPYADHILIPQGSTGSSIFFDIK